MSAPAPRPTLPFKQILELVRYSTLTEPAYGSTLQTGPLAYHGLIWTPGDGARHVITERGRRWLAAWDAYRADRADRARKLSGPQLATLQLIAGERVAFVGTERTVESLYSAGLIDPDRATRSGWVLTTRGAELMSDRSGSMP